MSPIREMPDGLWPVTLTPFRDDGSIDWPAYGTLLAWYLDHGAAGIFTVCLSNEFNCLSPVERHEMAVFASRAVGGRVPVAASAGFGETPAARRDDVCRMAETGVDAIILPITVLVDAEADEGQLIDVILDLVAPEAGIPFGLYECPWPYRRLLSPEALGRLARASAGRIVFLKDTCCHEGTLRKKLAAIRGTPLKLFNANLATTLSSLTAGAAGHCGIAANFYPGLLAELCRIHRTDPARATTLQRFFDALQPMVDHKYPRGAKAYLRGRGQLIGEYCRVDAPRLTPEDRALFTDLGERLIEPAAAADPGILDPVRYTEIVRQLQSLIAPPPVAAPVA